MTCGESREQCGECFLSRFDFCIRLFCPRPLPRPPAPPPLLPPSPRARARASPRSGSAPNGSVCDPWTVRRGTGRATCRAMGCRACPFPSRVARSAARPAQRARAAARPPEPRRASGVSGEDVDRGGGSPRKRKSAICRVSALAPCLALGQPRASRLRC